MTMPSAPFLSCCATRITARANGGPLSIGVAISNWPATDVAPETPGAVGDGSAACSTLADSTMTAAATIQRMDTRDTTRRSHITAHCAVCFSHELNCNPAELAEIGVQCIALAREHDARE